MRKLKPNGPGANSQSCGKSCRKSCCEEAPPQTLKILFGSVGCPCQIGTLTYTEDDNPDGHPGMWVGTVEITCNGDCLTTAELTIEMWCNHRCGCTCDCEDWAMRVNEGTIRRINVDNALDASWRCCCGGFGGRNWAMWDNYLIEGGPCNGKGFWLHASWTNENQCAKFVQTACCISPIATTLALYISGPIGVEGPFPLIYDGADDAPVPCGDGSTYCQGATWSASSASGKIHCRGSGSSGGTFHEMDWSFILCCNGNHPTPSSLSSEWSAKLTVECDTSPLEQLLTFIACPDCHGTPFSADNTTFSFSPCSEDCDDTNEFTIYVVDQCPNQWGCPGMPTNFPILRVVAYGEGDDCRPCGYGNLYWEPTANECGCVGQYVGSVSYFDGEGCLVTTEALRLCSNCAECDWRDCNYDQWQLSVNGGGATSAEDACCGDISQNFKSYITFGKYRIYWATGDSTILPADVCPNPLQSLYFHYTDPCGNTRSAGLAGGARCNDPDYYGVWTTTTQFQCVNGGGCSTNQVWTVTLRLKRNKTWEAVLEGCFDESPKVAEVTVTCGECNTSKLSGSGTFSGPFTGCGGACDTANSIPFTIIEA